MNPRMALTFGLGALAAAGLLLAGCVEPVGGEVDVGADYYGPAYGEPVYYGHPWYHDDVIVARPPERHFTPRPEPRHEAPHPAARPAPRSGGGDRDRDHH